MPQKPPPPHITNVFSNVGPHPHASIIQPSNANPNIYAPPNFAQPAYLIKGANPPANPGTVAPSPTGSKAQKFAGLPSLAITVQH